MTGRDLATVGILGGMSSESTRTYYEQIDRRVNDALGGHNAGDLVIRSVNFAEIERCIRTEQWDEASDLLADAALDLEAAGADFVVMATNTMHRVAPDVETALSIPFVHIVDPTAEALRADHVETVGVLGTEAVMDGSFYHERFRSHDIETVVPDREDRAAVDRIIFEELTAGRVEADSRERYLEVIERLVADGAEGIVLGCTEIELLVEQSDCPETPVYDTTALHVDRAVERSLEHVTD